VDNPRLNAQRRLDHIKSLAANPSVEPGQSQSRIMTSAQPTVSPLRQRMIDDMRMRKQKQCCHSIKPISSGRNPWIDNFAYTSGEAIPSLRLGSN
jgi:hypothetical protein